MLSGCQEWGMEPTKGHRMLWAGDGQRQRISQRTERWMLASHYIFAATETWLQYFARLRDRDTPGCLAEVTCVWGPVHGMVTLPVCSLCFRGHPPIRAGLRVLALLTGSSVPPLGGEETPLITQESASGRDFSSPAPARGRLSSWILSPYGE